MSQSTHRKSDSAQVTAQTEMPQSAAVQTFPTKTEADSAYIRNDFAASVEMYENILKKRGGIFRYLL